MCPEPMLQQPTPQHACKYSVDTLMRLAYIVFVLFQGKSVAMVSTEPRKHKLVYAHESNLATYLHIKNTNCTTTPAGLWWSMADYMSNI